MTRRLLALLVTACAVTTTLALPSLATASPAKPASGACQLVAGERPALTEARSGDPKACPGNKSVTYAMNYMKGRHIGPNSDTDGGEATITGFTAQKQPSGPTLEVPKLKVTHPCTNCMDASGTKVTPANPNKYNGPNGRALGTDGIVHPDSWYNPGSWNWGHILGDINTEVNKCLKGSAEALVPTVSGGVALKILMDGGDIIEYGPEGAAAVAVGGCVAGIIFG